MQDLLILWDAIFADSSTFDLVDYVFVAMLNYLKHACQYFKVVALFDATKFLQFSNSWCFISMLSICITEKTLLNIRLVNLYKALSQCLFPSPVSTNRESLSCYAAVWTDNNIKYAQHTLRN